MTLPRDLFALPKDFPMPIDDGACNHLAGMTIPDLGLLSTRGGIVNIYDASQKPSVFFFYPRTGRPEEPAPVDWDLIPGARGCTPQSCGFRDHHADFARMGVNVFGVSTQTNDYQKEFATRTDLPFEILSDEQFALTEALDLPTFTYNSMRLIKRLALFVERGKIVKTFYPVFPPDQNASAVLESLAADGKREV